jgi:phosphoglycerate dehydrogenase-like enzyme
MPRVAVLDDYQSVALDLADWSPLHGRADVEVFHDHLDDEDALVDRLQPFDVVVAMRERTAFPRSVVQRLPALRLLVTTGPFNAAVDLAACRDRGVVVSGTGGDRYGTRDLTWALILAGARHLPTEAAYVRSGGWMTTVGTDLHGAVLGLCGLGRIGAMVAQVGQAFGMELVAWSQNLTAERASELGAELVSKDELLRRSDVLTIHLVLSERTRGLVGEAELRSMKPSAFLVNTSRGPICDEDALARACAERWIAGAALDAYEVEPLPAGHPFRTLDNVIATPHIGYITNRSYRIFFADVVEDVVAFLDGSPVRVVDPRA